MAPTKFFWGDKALDDRIFGVAITYAATAFWYVLTQVIPDGGGPAIDNGMALKAPVNKKTGEPVGGEVAGTIVATIVWIWVYYNGMGVQVFTRLIKQNNSEAATYAASRIMGNTFEHAIIFLPLLWLHCAYINSIEAAYLGLFYCAHRIGYQIFYGIYGQFTYLCESCTQPGYMVCYYFAFSLLCACYGKNLTDYLPAGALLIPTLMFTNVFMFMVGWGVPTGHFVSGLVDKAHPKSKKA